MSHSASAAAVEQKKAKVKKTDTKGIPAQRTPAAADDYYDGDYGGEDGSSDGPPWIDPETPTNVTVVAGRTAILACVVRQLGTASVRQLGSQVEKPIVSKLHCTG